MLRLVFLIVIDIMIVAGISIGVGATAPRWRGRWLTRDFGPLHFAPWETPKFFRALKTRKLAKRLPELGSAFGGKAKSELPGRTDRPLFNRITPSRVGTLGLAV